MLKLGMHVDNWRHFDVSYDVPCRFARDHGMEYVEFGTIDGDYFIQALGYNPHVPPSFRRGEGILPLNRTQGQDGLATT